MKSIISRLEALEEIQKVKDDKKETERLETTPILFIAPWELIKNEINVTYYPKGKKNGAEWEKTISIDEVIGLLDVVDPGCYADLSMGACLEWIYAFHIARKNGSHDKIKTHYTDTQIDRVTAQWKADYPELSYLESEEGQALIKVLQELPQAMIVSCKEWIEVLKRGA